MRSIGIECIVEGEGEVKSFPVLVRRILKEIDRTIRLDTPDEATKVSRYGIVKPGELERHIEIAARKIVRPGAILLLLAADDDCPATLAPQLLQRAIRARSDTPVSVLLAQREYEAWFLAAAESLRGVQGLPNTMTPPDAPETIHDAKGWLKKQMAAGKTYRPTIDQLPLTRRFDLQTARSADSFDKLYCDMVRLLSELVPPSAEPENAVSE